MRLRITLPLSCAEIQRKALAWRELAGSDPIVTISGHIQTDDGEIVRPNHSEVTQIGRKWLVVRLDGAYRRIDPTSCDERFLCYLYFEVAA